MLRCVCTIFIFANTCLFIPIHGAQAAIKKENLNIIDSIKGASQSDTREALLLPLANRMQVLSAQGPAGYKNLTALMLDSKEPLEVRWNAVVAIGRIGRSLSEPELQKAVNSESWILRNAAMVSAASVDRDMGVKFARKLIGDRALVVRASAVDVLRELSDRESVELLWENLNSKQNYRKKQSLFIRRKIAEALSRLESPGSESRFVALLGDQDVALHRPAIRALERLTTVTLGAPKDSLATKRDQWKRWWNEGAVASAPLQDADTKTIK